MRTLFLAAKKFAMEDHSEKITMEHVREALGVVDIVDSDLKSLLIFYDGIGTVPKPSCVFMIDELEEASKYKTIVFDNDVKKLKNFLELNGFSFNETATKLYFKKENNITKLKKDIAHLEASLTSQIFGQNQAIDVVCDKIVESHYNIASSTPKAIFLFLGPPATGKTFLSQILADTLNGFDGNYKIFDMTQFLNEESGVRLYGQTRMYANAIPGELTSYVKKYPKSIVILDEFEKAHPTVQTNLLTVLSGAYLDDACGWCKDGKPWVYGDKRVSSDECQDENLTTRVDFKETIIIFTSNLGSELYNNQNFTQMLKDNPLQAQSTILEALGREEKKVNGSLVKAFKPELLSRLSQGKIVLFNKLPFDSLSNIAKNEIIKTQESFEKEFGLDVSYESFTSTTALLILSFAPLIDVRKLKSKLPIVLFDIVTDYIRKHDEVFDNVQFKLNSESLEMIEKDFSTLGSEEQIKFLHELFRKNETFIYDTNSEISDNTLIVEFSNFRKIKLARSVDFTGDGGLVFEVPQISFSEIAGHNIAKERLKEVINILKYPEELEQFNILPPKGMLLYGKPGTGKTMLAKAFAHEADLPFIETTGSEILDMELMKNIFKKAREYAPSIIFIDEIDAIGYRDGSHKDIYINHFLTELNGFSDNSDEQIFVMAATNLKEKIDPAILRSGRIDLHIEIDQLDRDARVFFLDKILEKPTTGEFDKESILTYTAGMTGADLEKVERETSLYVYRNKEDAITEEILIEQINTIKYGSRIVHRSIHKLIESTATHEAGHAVVSRVLMPNVKIEQITVVPRNNALGFISYNRDTDINNLTQDDIKNKLCVAFAGRVAQLKKYGREGLDSGAANDLSMATRLAYYAISELGMGETTGYISLSELKEDIDLFKKEIEAEVKKWLDEAQERTIKLIDEHWTKVTSLATILQEKEIVDESEFIKIMEKSK